MNSNKVFDNTYFWQLILFEFIPYLGVFSQICILDLHENIIKPLDGAYLADFDIDITES